VLRESIATAFLRRPVVHTVSPLDSNWFGEKKSIPIDPNPRRSFRAWVKLLRWIPIWLNQAITRLTFAAH